jgi:bifunctional non-homologous end joining protein LigD
MRLSYKPMLAQNADAPFNSLDWIFEIKWDGIRAISYVNSELSIRSRNGKELKYNFPELEELKTLAKSVVLDGEIVVMKNGKADFQTVLERSRTGSSMDIEYEARKSPATYVIFDILERDGKTLTNRPLIERKKVLKECVAEGKQVLLSVFIEKEGQAYYEAAVAKGVEGIMAKKKDSLYEPGARSSNWLKIKKLLS